MNAQQHATDHQRLAAAHAAWVAAGRPRTGTRETAAQRQARRTFGLRLLAHAQVVHGHTLGIGHGLEVEVAAHDAGQWPNNKEV